MLRWLSERRGDSTLEAWFTVSRALQALISGTDLALVGAVDQAHAAVRDLEPGPAVEVLERVVTEVDRCLSAGERTSEDLVAAVADAVALLKPERPDRPAG